jgi:hypothetical protein
MPAAFETHPSRDWRGVSDELREVLTAEEYASARASTPNAHYTSPEIIQTIWKGMERFGFRAGGHILEPSMGVGHFFGLMPEGLYVGTRRTGVELDSITARIAAKLYPDSNVHGKALEDTALPKDFFDAAVGNIPFGNYSGVNALLFDAGATARAPRLKDLAALEVSVLLHIESRLRPEILDGLYEVASSTTDQSAQLVFVRGLRASCMAADDPQWPIYALLVLDQALVQLATLSYDVSGNRIRYPQDAAWLAGRAAKWVRALLLSPAP